MRKPRGDRRFLVEFRSTGDAVELMQAYLVKFLTNMNTLPPAGFDIAQGDYIRVCPVEGTPKPVDDHKRDAL